MKKIISFILVMVICFCSQIFTVGVSAEKGRGNYKINDKGEVQVDLNIPKAQTNKYYIDQVTESVYGSTDPATRVPHLPIVRADEFEAKYFLPLKKKNCGTIDKININGSNVYVYLPKDYDPESEERYNVLFLSVASGHKAESYMIADHRKQVPGVSSELPYRKTEMPTLIFKDLYDTITYYDKIPLIYVAIGGQTEFTEKGTHYAAAIQKYIVQNYKTYAENDSAEALTDARYHFGIAGISGGGSYSTQVALNDYCDRFGYVATFDGSFYTKWDEEHITPKAVDLFYGNGPEGTNGQCSTPGNINRYLGNISTCHVYIEPILGHDYLLSAIGIYQIAHQWFQ